MQKAALLFVLILLCGFHPIHVSITEIEFDEKEKSLEVMMRIFADDLEITMKNRYSNPTLDILNPAGKSLDEMMRDYLAEKFVVSVDGKKVALNYLGHEREGEAFVFYIEIPKIKKLRTISITNGTLTETYEDQSNLVHVTNAGTVKSLRLTRGNLSGTLSF